MTTVKIISNPYDKKITYQRKNETTGQWLDITYDSNPNSSLLTEELSNGFFPFYVNKIVDAIIEEYQENNQVFIEFEGTEDEYQELVSVCEDEAHKDAVVLKKSDRYLENARDILPDIIRIFQKLDPLISETVKGNEKIQSELKKFSDAANDRIPICVLGNYSSGKSTFINALIGSEIMPSGDEPVTARVYKVSRSRQPDRAEIAFSCEGDFIRIRFDPFSFHVVSGESDGELIAGIKEELEDSDSKSIEERVHMTLVRINDFENQNQEKSGISDLIEVSVPFHGGLWKQSDNEFVIFDTPGSNSASNDRHMEVLKKAMENLSNGLPVFVSEYNTLDSMDNEKLNQMIHEIPELDSRFTMIIVNKADAASLPKSGFDDADIMRILGEAIPRSLFSEGIFFVSSVMGLGSKTGGQFIDEHSSEIFDDQEQKYCDPENKRYKQLYLYDIMPGKQKEHAVKAAQKQNEPLFVNSGLYCVEREILIFATKYSAYNKCRQSGIFLGRVIDMVSEEIALAKQDREKTRKKCEEQLDADKQELIAQIKEDGSRILEEGKQNYPESMDETLQAVRGMYYQESLRDEMQELYTEYKKALDIEGSEKESEKAVKNIGDGFWNNIREMKPTPDLLKNIRAIGKAGEGLMRDTKSAIDQKKDLTDRKKELVKTVSDQLVDLLNNDFQRYCSRAQEIIHAKSAEYWSLFAAEIRQHLAQLVTGSAALSSEKRDELSEIIRSYQEIDFSTRKKVFKKDDYEYVFKIGDLVIWKSDKLNLERLRRHYNSEMERNVKEILDSVVATHENNVGEWIQNLYDVIENNIVSYSPKLRSQQELIDRETARILELEKKEEKVYQYSEEIQSKMEWRTV